MLVGCSEYIHAYDILEISTLDIQFLPFYYHSLHHEMVAEKGGS